MDRIAQIVYLQELDRKVSYIIISAKQYWVDNFIYNIKILSISINNNYIFYIKYIKYDYSIRIDNYLIL